MRRCRSADKAISKGDYLEGRCTVRRRVQRIGLMTVMLAGVCSVCRGKLEGGVWEYEEGAAAFEKRHYVEAVERLEGYLSWSEKNGDEAQYRQDAMVKASTCYLRLQPWTPWKPLEYARLLLKDYKGEEGNGTTKTAVGAFEKLTQLKFGEAEALFWQLAEALASQEGQEGLKEDAIREARLLRCICRAFMVARYDAEAIFAEIDDMMEGTGRQERTHGLCAYVGAMIGIYRAEWEAAERYLTILRSLEGFDGKKAVGEAIDDLLGMDARLKGLMSQEDNPVEAALETIEKEAGRLIDRGRGGAVEVKEEVRPEEE